MNHTTTAVKRVSHTVRITVNDIINLVRANGIEIPKYTKAALEDYNSFDDELGIEGQIVFKWTDADETLAG